LKLTKEQVVSIKEFLQQGALKQYEIAKMYNVSQGRISQIKKAMSTQSNTPEIISDEQGTECA
jgi:predicted XRE-type DNA-binding protein